MGYRNGVPMKFKPRGYVDALDGMNTAPGGMSALTDLIPDPSTMYAFQCRPAAALVQDFTAVGSPFSNPGAISAAFQIGGYVYGLVSTLRTAGYDEPFSYDIATGTFVTVSGVTSSNVPASAGTEGDWTPPTVAVMGPYVVFTHPGFNGVNGYFGYFDTTTPTAPVWHSGNTTTNGLTGLPLAVQLFYNRLYFAVGNALEYTDTLSFNVSNPSQQITAGDSLPITALSLFNLTTTTQGILQGLLVFKRNTILQVTGDQSFSNLAINSLNTSAGTVAPMTVVPTPAGVFFVASDGVRIVSPDGLVSEPDSDARVPFLNAVSPSRMSANYNSDVYRICTQNGGKPGSPWEEYWYDLGREIWTGPHSFQQDIAVPYNAGFLLFSHLNPAKMFRSEVTQVAGVTFVELGEPMTWVFQTTPVGEEDSMAVNTMSVATVNIAFASGSSPVSCTASDESGGTLGVAVINPPTSTVTIWGSFFWGNAVWFGYQYGIAPKQIPWTSPVVFTKIIFQATSESSLGFKISTLRMMNQPTPYVIPWVQGGNSGSIPIPVSGFVWDTSYWDTTGLTWPV